MVLVVRALHFWCDVELVYKCCGFALYVRLALCGGYRDQRCSRVLHLSIDYDETHDPCKLKSFLSCF